MATTDGHERGQGGATLEAVARVAGVSRATVSRVVNESPRVSPDVRLAVEAAIRQLGYTPNRAARTLVTRRSDSIAVVITEPTGRLFSDPFFPRLVRGVSGALAARDLQLVLLMPEPAEEARTIRYLTGGHVDGALLVSLHGNDPIPSALADRGVPLVFVGRPPHASEVSYVDVDNRQGGRRATTHLLEGGARRVATVAGPPDMAAGVDRLEGYRDAIRADGGQPEEALIARGDFTYEGGAAAMERLLETAPDLDAVFVASDLMAAGAIGVLLARGRRVPEDVALVGYDDSPIAAATRPPLTSVRQPIEEMGREAVHLLLDAIERAGRPPRRVVLATELMLRASSARRDAS
ncbi:MAG TPA: LacI family DNA-binding transcriptional regulator [Candidatus Limnocylindrales bacterium]|nr:LacI family DNA-binding transcriptional regulator [Candidatus Limnocylindrales bacterium]